MRFGEIVWKRLNRSAKRIGSLRRIRKCDHLVSEREQALCNVLAAEAKSPCYRDPHAGFPSDREDYALGRYRNAPNGWLFPTNHLRLRACRRQYHNAFPRKSYAQLLFTEGI